MNDVITSAYRGWLTEQMQLHRYTPQMLSTASGVHHTTISRLLAGRRSPSLDTAARLAFVFGIPEASASLDVLSVGAVLTDPVRRVEAALRSDPAMTEQGVSQTMRVYRDQRSR